MSAAVLVARRAFLQLTGLTAGAFVLGCRASDRSLSAADVRSFDFDLFLSLDESGAVRVIAHRSEMFYESARAVGRGPGAGHADETR